MTETKITVTPGIPQVIVEREFDAPAELLLRVHLDPELLKQWLGPRDLTLTVDRYETHNGGTWRYVMGGGDEPEGNQAAGYRAKENARPAGRLRDRRRASTLQREVLRGHKRDRRRARVAIGIIRLVAPVSVVHELPPPISQAGRPVALCPPTTDGTEVSGQYA